jgi:hypothetical protein
MRGGRFPIGGWEAIPRLLTAIPPELAFIRFPPPDGAFFSFHLWKKESAMTQLSPGDPAPDFSLEDQNGNTVQLSDFRGKTLLLYFYPRANTSGCTTQATAVSEALPDLSGQNVAAVGISPDKPAQQK